MEDCNSFEMCKMMVRTEQLLCIAEATNSKIYTRDSQAKAHGWVKSLVLMLKQCHTHYYHFYKNRMTRAMVGLQRLHSSDTFRCSNVSSGVGLKFFCPWCFKSRGYMKMITTHLREVHYQLAISCDLCKSFTSRSPKNILDHCSGCKAKCTKEFTEQEGCEKAKKSTSPRHESRKKHPKVSSSSTDES